LISLLLILFSILTPFAAKSQLVGGAVVKANVGVDADVYANRLQFGPAGTTAAGTDDWFKNALRWPGAGLNIINMDDSAANKAAILANNNHSFEERMSVPFNTIVNGRVWLDAVYGRDNNATGNNIDASTFAGQSNKNGDNPTTWALGPGGTPQKNDIVDVWGHLRRNGTTAADSVWGFGGATTMSADGNSHNDFEFFRAPFSYTGTGFTATGPNEGHTAWRFDNTGNILVPGDVLVAIDFENGGTVPKASVRVWIAKTTFDSLMIFNTLANRPFRLTGTFDQGNGATLFGYAGIDTKTPATGPSVYAVVNTTANTPAAPWGSLEGGADYQDDIQTLQFSEFAINLTAFGLDRRNDNQAPCDNILGTLLVKTRSSSSFTAELKDFAGPYQFGNFTEVDVTANSSNNLSCANPTTTLSATNVIPAGATITWYGPSPDAGVSLGPVIPGNSPIVGAAGIYTVRASTQLANCFAEDKVTVTGTVVPNTAEAGGPDVVCQSATPSAITLTGASVGGSSTTGAWSIISGGGTLSNINQTASPQTVTYTPAPNFTGTVTLRLTSNAVGSCVPATDDRIITVNPAATANAGSDVTRCANSPAVVLAGSVGGGASSGTWSGGSGSFNPNNTTLNATYTPSAAEITAGTVTLTLTTNDPAGPCGPVNDQVTITINPVATANAGQDVTVCANNAAVVLAGTVGGGATSGTWSGGTGTFNPNNTTLNATYTPSPAEITAGTVTLTLTTNDPAGPCNAATDQMTITINPVATANAGQDVTRCANSPAVVLAGSVGGGASSGTWSGGTGTFNPNNTTLTATYTPSPAEITAGTVTLTLTTNDPAGPCNAATDQMTITINPVATANAGADRTVCASSPAVVLAGSVGGGASSGTWSGGTGTFNPNNTTLTATYTPSAAEITAGTVTLTLTTNDPAGPCNAATDQMTITYNRVTPGSVGADQTFCFSDPRTGPVPFTSVTAGTASGVLSYQWLSSTTGCNGPWTAIPNSNTAGFNQFVIPFTQNVYYKRVATSTLLGSVCRDTSNCVAILSGPCGGPFPPMCSYTQGYFGNRNGNSCDGDTTYGSPVQLIQYLLGVTTNPVALNPLTVGRPGHSVTIPASLAGATRLNSILPGGGAADSLRVGDCIITNACINGYLSGQGRIKNNLLSQTIVLSLNARMNSGILAGWGLDYGYLVTRDQRGCGTDATAIECVDDSSTIESEWMNTAVIDYLTDFGTVSADVSDLLDLANDLLGRARIPGTIGANGNIVPSYSAVLDVVDAINNAFDGCRIPLGYFECEKNCANFFLPCPVIVAKSALPVAVAENKISEPSLSVNAYPNPFADVLNLRIVSPVSGVANIEVYNSTGVRILATTRYVSANAPAFVTYKAPLSAGSLHYKVIVGSYKSNGIAVKVK